MIFPLESKYFFSPLSLIKLIFPLLSSKTTSFKGDVLANAINKTLFAVSGDDLRPAMTGVFFELSKDGVQFVATDAHRLVRYKRTDTKATQNASFIVPKKPLTLLKDGESIMEKQLKNITKYFDINDVNIVVGFKKDLIMERFPEVNYVYNPFFDTTNTSKSLLQALKKK